MNQYKFVIPPRFARKIEQFRVHCQVALQKPTARLAPTEDHRDPLPKPIMIVGPTGVGKTLFLTIFKKLYRDNYPDDKKHPIVEANCAHFGGDHNMIRSELFGHVKGAFTGALYNKVGVVAAANNGLLILEEIGDLPPETQAMLLSFIETGEYYRVGDEYTKEGRPNPKKAYVQIVSATNRENVIRGDLKYRFFPFYVPPLHERRHDILYYLHAKYPELIGTLTPSEVLALLSHNWPGNVREIERVGWLLTREKLLRSSLLSSNYEDPYRLFKIRSQEMDLNLEFIANISRELKKNDIDTKRLEGILNPYGLGLSFANKKKVFTREIPHDGSLGGYADPELNILMLGTCPPFERVFEGVQVFCHLFFQDSEGDKNVLDLGGKFTMGNLPSLADKGVDVGLVIGIFEYLSGIKVSEKRKVLYKSTKELFRLFEELAQELPDNEFLASLGFSQKKITEGEQLNLGAMPKNEVLKRYYGELLKQTRGNRSKAAELAGEPLSTFRDNLKKLSIMTVKTKGTD